MQIDLKQIKRKILEIYPFFGSVMVNIKYVETEEIDTIGTDGYYIYFNPKFIQGLSEEERISMFCHELSHIYSNHIERGKGKNDELWKIATNAVVNALLKEDGLKIIDGEIDFPEASKYSAEEIYEKLEKIKITVDKTGLDNHQLWEERNYIIKQKINDDEHEHIDKEFEEAMEQLAKKLEDNKKPPTPRLIGEIDRQKPIVPWQRILSNEVELKKELSYRNAIIRDGIVKPQMEKFPSPEAEILLDVSGSVSKELLTNFLKECRNIFKKAEIKVGCFDEEFYGFKKIKSLKDIEEMEIKGGGATDFNVAVNAFTGKVKNKIIFTDGRAEEPEKYLKAIWIVFDEDRKIEPKGGKVIYITKEQLKMLEYNEKDVER